MHRWFRCALLACVVAVAGAGSASAAMIKVTTKKDEFDTGPKKCSLREAVQAANTDKKFGGCPRGKGRDVIVLGRGVYELSIPGTGEDENADGDLDSRGNLTIRGKGRAKTTIDGNGNVLQERILERVEGNLTVAKLTMRNADAYTSEYYGAGVGAEESSAEGGTLTLRGVSIEDNYSYYSGGGIGVRYGNLKVLKSRILDNDVDDYGGGIYFDADGRLEIRNSVIAGNRADDYTGGVYTDDGVVVIDRTVVRDNAAYSYGGGIHLDAQSAKITRSTISGNYSYGDDGGGLYVYSVDEPAIVESTTISNNHAGDEGGGVYVYSPAIFRNSTISRNYGYSYGGGIYAYDDVTLLNSTVARNGAYYGGGGIYNHGYDVEYRNSIVARNHVNGDTGDFEDCGGASNTSLGHNLLGDGTCASTGSDITGESGAPLDPKLGALGNYGGPTETLPLLAGSPAIDKGQNCLKKDQRGRKRKGKCDIGAFER